MRSPAGSSTGPRSQAASCTAWTSESWPRLGQPWFMSRMATSIVRSSAGGTSDGGLDAHVVVAIGRERRVGHSCRQYSLP